MSLAELAVSKGEPYHEPTLHLLADCLPQMVWCCTEDGYCDFVNRSGLEYTGLSLQQHLSINWLELVLAEDRSRLHAQWQTSLQAGTELHMECRLRRHDADHRWFEIRSVRLPDVGARQKWLVTAGDIQEIVESRQALSAGEKELRSVFDTAPVAISLEDWRGVIAAVNALRDEGIADLRQYLDLHPETVDRLLDLIILRDTNELSLSLFDAEHRGQLVGSSLRWLFNTPNARAQFIELLIGIAKGRPRPSLAREMELTTLSGAPIRVLSHARERQPEVEAGILLVSRIDVTELRRKDEQLARQSALLERMSSMAKVGGWVFDVSTRKGTCTREMSHIHGINPYQEVSLDKTMSVFASAERTLLNKALQRAIAHAEPYDFEMPMVTPDGQHKWVRTQGLPIVRDGTVVRVEGAIQDITDRKLAELEVVKLNATLEQQVKERTEQWQRANHDLQNILDALPTMVGYWDRDLRLQFCNRSYSEGLAMSPQEMYGKHATELMKGKKLQAERLPRMYLALRGEPQRFEAVSNRPINGQHRRRVQIHYQPDVVDGEVRGIYVLIIDLSSLQQVEDALRAANHELDAFAYAVAHDLRAPLRAMNGFSGALLEDCATSLDADARQYAQEINKASRRMGELLDGLLVLSRSTQGDMQFNRIDMTALTQTLAEELQRNEPQRSVEWQVAPDMVTYGDARMIEAALRNLLGNAWKYTGRTAQPVISVDTLSADGVVQFCISDNGAGFDMAHADRLFKPFQRLHRQDEFIGIGVGLATVKRIVQRHGGEIRAEATPGQGARFIFHLNSRATGQQP